MSHDLQEAFDLCYDHLCDLHFCLTQPSLNTADFQQAVLDQIEITSRTNPIFIKKKQEEDGQ